MLCYFPYVFDCYRHRYNTVLCLSATCCRMHGPISPQMVRFLPGRFLHKLYAAVGFDPGFLIKFDLIIDLTPAVCQTHFPLFLSGRFTIGTIKQIQHNKFNTQVYLSAWCLVKKKSERLTTRNQR